MKCSTSLESGSPDTSHLGSCLLLVHLPYNLLISNLSFAGRVLYTKSPGTYSKRLKSKKTEKLLKIQLPSGKIVFLHNYSTCYIGKNSDQHKKQVNEGKWGFSTLKSKKIEVRGVAMNPVDHPNGGRCKAKQPERSPWGWVAKRNK